MLIKGNKGIQTLASCECMCNCEVGLMESFRPKIQKVIWVTAVQQH